MELIAFNLARKQKSSSLTGVKFEWSGEFKHFFIERKKRRKVRDPEITKYHRNLFEQFL